jgi:hypothetical protein
MRSPALMQINEHGTRKEDIPNTLLSTSFSYTTCDDIGDDVSGLNDSEQQLAEFA